MEKLSKLDFLVRTELRLLIRLCLVIVARGRNITTSVDLRVVVAMNHLLCSISFSYLPSHLSRLSLKMKKKGKGKRYRRYLCHSQRDLRLYIF